MTNRARLPHDWFAMSRRQQAEHMDTLAWLDAQAGPRPSVLPEGWG